MILEGTPEFQRGFDAVCPQPKPLTPQQMMHRIVQGVLADIDYPFGSTARDDETWWQLQAIEEENGLPEGITHDDCYNLFRTNYNGERDD